MSRVLVPPPAAFVDAAGAPSFGSFKGPLPAVTVPGLSFGARFARRKKWVWLAITTPKTWITLGVVRTGYAATAFAYAYDFERRKMIAEETAMAPTFASVVADDPNRAGVIASFRSIGRRITITRDETGLTIHAALATISVTATLDASASPPPIAAIGSLGNLGSGLWDATEKRALATVTGTATLAGEPIVLDGAIGGWDYTHGLLPRHTLWRWAFALGADAAGAPLAFNVVSGFLGEAECAAFGGGETHPLAEPRFVFDAAHPEAPWRLEGDGFDLTFSPGAVHAQYNNLGIVRSRFVQPVGVFDGTLRVDGKDRILKAVPGVVENQDVVW